jgi:uncharacterized protein
MTQIHASIACNLDNNILQTALPLFMEEKVEAIEWSFDALYKERAIPQWFVELLQAFSQEKRLIGHGIYFSLFSGKWSKAQQDWLAHLKKVTTNFQFDHITEHFGFMTGQNFHDGAPISIPFTKSTLAIGQDRLLRMSDACACPVGLENLAFSYSLEEVKRHGDFLHQLIEPVNGFIILDLHNLYCQIHNFDIDYEDIITLYPLDRVREIHISGGSWETSTTLPQKQVRRDTHDDQVPQEVFELLKKTIPRCPNLKFVVMEQIGTGLKTPESKSQFQADFQTMSHILQLAHKPQDPTNHFLPKNPITLGTPIEDNDLHADQIELSRILETAADTPTLFREIQTSRLANSAWKTEAWSPFMLETAMHIAQKWKGEER